MTGRLPDPAALWQGSGGPFNGGEGVGAEGGGEGSGDEDLAADVGALDDDGFGEDA